jgi:hypothetical protein
MIVPSWLPECAISRPNQALIVAGEGVGQGRPQNSIVPFGPKTLPHGGIRR